MREMKVSRQRKTRTTKIMIKKMAMKMSRNMMRRKRRRKIARSHSKRRAEKPLTIMIMMSLASASRMTTRRPRLTSRR